MFKIAEGHRGQWERLSKYGEMCFQINNYVNRVHLWIEQKSAYESTRIWRNEHKEQSAFISESQLINTHWMVGSESHHLAGIIAIIQARRIDEWWPGDERERIEFYMSQSISWDILSASKVHATRLGTIWKYVTPDRMQKNSVSSPWNLSPSCLTWEAVGDAWC